MQIMHPPIFKNFGGIGSKNTLSTPLASKLIEVINYAPNVDFRWAALARDLARDPTITISSSTVVKNL